MGLDIKSFCYFEPFPWPFPALSQTSQVHLYHSFLQTLLKNTWKNNTWQSNPDSSTKVCKHPIQVLRLFETSLEHKAHDCTGVMYYKTHNITKTLEINPDCEDWCIVSSSSHTHARHQRRLGAVISSLQTKQLESPPVIFPTAVGVHSGEVKKGSIGRVVSQQRPWGLKEDGFWGTTVQRNSEAAQRGLSNICSSDDVLAQTSQAFKA